MSNTFVEVCIYEVKPEKTEEFESLIREVKEHHAAFKGVVDIKYQHAGRLAGRTIPEQWNFIKTYESSNIPITIINGTHDFADIQGKMYTKWFANIPNISYYLIQNAGHNAWIDKPEQFRELLLKALKK